MHEVILRQLFRFLTAKYIFCKFHVKHVLAPVFVSRVYMQESCKWS